MGDRVTGERGIELPRAAPMIRLSQLIFGRILPVPRVTWLLTAACVLTTLPMFFSRRYYLILGVGDERVDARRLRWWHPLTTVFVHGGGWPGTTAHLLINCSLFVVLGSLTERLLGAGRYASLLGVCLGVHLLLKELLIDGRGHGASGMTWSYLPFSVFVLVWSWKRRGRRVLRDPIAVVTGLMVLFELLGLVKHWHLWNALTAVPFFIRWRSTVRDNLQQIAVGGTPDLGARWANICGCGATAALVAVPLLLTVAAVAGMIPPAAIRGSR